MSGAIYNPIVHFEAPPSSEMQHEITAFIFWFFETKPNGAKPQLPRTLLALSQTIQCNRRAYYDALEQKNKAIEITAWLDYFCKTVIEAQTQSQRMIDFLIEKTKLYDQIRGRVNDRQQRALDRIFREGPDGLKGGLSAANYIAITGATRATATPDLSDLVNQGVFIQTGELKSTRYWLRLNL